MTATIIEIGLVSLVLIGIIKEEKLIAFEDKVLDVAAKAIAKVIIARRRHELEKAKLAPMPGIKAYIAPKRHSKANLVCSEFEF
ncbi:MAG: hypothetical protein IJE14_05650 [Clostridia bacterium]|nr:hypothetical protein [Clostridia bacterium]